MPIAEVPLLSDGRNAAQWRYAEALVSDLRMRRRGLAGETGTHRYVTPRDSFGAPLSMDAGAPKTTTPVALGLGTIGGCLNPGERPRR